MFRMTRILSVGFGFLILPFVLFNFVFACSCLAPGSPEECLSGASAVFVGRVEKITDMGGYRGNSVVFTVLDTYKGDLAQDVSVYTEFTEFGGSCGYPFKLGETYFVYAYPTAYEYHEKNNVTVNDKFETDWCSRTKKLSEAQEDIAALEKFLKPKPYKP